jgi:hypothetical protein
VIRIAATGFPADRAVLVNVRGVDRIDLCAVGVVDDQEYFSPGSSVIYSYEPVSGDHALEACAAVSVRRLANIAMRAGNPLSGLRRGNRYFTRNPSLCRIAYSNRAGLSPHWHHCPHRNGSSVRLERTLESVDGRDDAEELAALIVLRVYILQQR